VNKHMFFDSEHSTTELGETGALAGTADIEVSGSPL